MNKDELEGYKANLIELREKYLKEKKIMEEGYLHDSQREASGDLSAYSIHMADVAADSYERDRSAGLSNNINNILYEIEDALFRIEKGVYGLCEVCHKQISFERLQAVPYARMCIDCKRMREKPRE